MLSKNEAGLYEQDIDGHIYEFSKWGADEATDVLMDLGALVGKPLGMALTMLSGAKGGDAPVDVDAIGAIMEHLSTAAFEKKTLCKHLIKKFATGCMCDGRRVDYNIHYADRLDHMFRVVRAAVEVQFGNFFGGLTGLSPGFQTLAGSPPVSNRSATR